VTEEAPLTLDELCRHSEAKYQLLRDS
jgi:hypothetical protein